MVRIQEEPAGFSLADQRGADQRFFRQPEGTHQAGKALRKGALFKGFNVNNGVVVPQHQDLPVRPGGQPRLQEGMRVDRLGQRLFQAFRVHRRIELQQQRNVIDR